MTHLTLIDGSQGHKGKLSMTFISSNLKCVVSLKVSN